MKKTLEELEKELTETKAALEKEEREMDYLEGTDWDKAEASVRGYRMQIQRIKGNIENLMNGTNEPIVLTSPDWEEKIDRARAEEKRAERKARMGITFEDIAKANATIKTTPIKGKDYAEVNQRIKVFRMLYPTGAITTEMLSNENGVCVFKATILDNNGKVLGTGTAFEERSSSFINKTSYIENCETSAVGRALAMCGIGIDVSVASYEEVANAIENQNAGAEAQKEADKQSEKITEVMAKALFKKADGNTKIINKILELYKVENIQDLKMYQYSNLNQNWDKLLEIVNEK